MTLNDKKYLAKYIECFNFMYENDQSSAVFIKDHTFCYRAINSNFLRIAEPALIEKDAVIGSYDNQIEQLRNMPEVVKKLNQQDIMVVETRKMHKFLHVTTAENAFLVKKSPIINPETDNVIGIFGAMQSFMLPNVLNIIYKINGISYYHNDDPKEKLIYPLTERQHMVLFLYVNKYSYAEIGHIMRTLGHQISDGRVNDHLENLKYIFAVKNKEQLIERAISLKYHLFIPRKFLKMGTYDLDDELIISNE